MPKHALAIHLSRDTFLEPFVGGPAFRLRRASGNGMSLADTLAELDRNGARFAHVRVESGNAEAVAALVAASFDHVETLVTWARTPVAQTGYARADGIRVRRARTEDLPACRRIAEAAFVHNRFNRDARMDPEAARKLKGEWMVNNFAGRADAILVTLDRDELTGFIACLRDGPDALVDLVAVAPERQGAGLGRALLEAAADEYAGRAMSLKAGTQADNAASARLYRASGFVPASSQETFHRWWLA